MKLFQRIVRLCLMQLAPPALLTASLLAGPSGPADAQLDEARALLSGTPSTEAAAKALQLIAPLAQAGHPKAEALHGYLCAKGIGLPKDEEAALVWFRKAADQGLASAQFNLGTMILKGRGTEANPEEGMKWIETAAAADHLEAQVRAADLRYFGGEGIAKAPEKAIPWLRKAAEAGHPWAQHMLANALEWGNGGLKADRAAALDWYRKAAEQGQPKAQSSLGRLLAGGTTPAEELEAYVWLRLSAEQNEITAINYIREHMEGLSEEQIVEGNRLYLRKKADLESRKSSAARP